MLFADDLVLCEETKEEAEQQLKVWRNAMESQGLRVGRNRELGNFGIRVQTNNGQQELQTVSKFKYLSSIIDAEGGVETELTGVVCDKNVPLKLKYQLYKTAIKPTLCYVR